jgi:hypothetical protein
MNNNNQNEQAQVQTNEQQQATKTTKSKPKRKPLFQEGTILHTIFYRITERVQAGEISFAKVFWIGFLIIVAINVIEVFVFNVSQITKEILDVIWCMIWVRHLWFARKQVYHPAWFYIGMGIAVFPILWFAIGFVKGFIPAFLAARRGY